MYSILYKYIYKNIKEEESHYLFFWILTLWYKYMLLDIKQNIIYYTEHK